MESMLRTSAAEAAMVVWGQEDRAPDECSHQPQLRRRMHDKPFAFPLPTMISALSRSRPSAFSVFRQCTRLSGYSRTFHASRPRRLPPTDGGLTNILSGGEAPAVQVMTITPKGIQLSDGLILPSACIFIDGKVFLWNVPEKPWDDWKQEHFEVFEAVVPKPG